MRTVVVNNILSLDGSYEGPGGDVMALTTHTHRVRDTQRRRYRGLTTPTDESTEVGAVRYVVEGSCGCHRPAVTAFTLYLAKPGDNG